MDQNMKDQLMAAAHNCRANGMLAAESAIYEAIKALGGRAVDTAAEEEEAAVELAATRPKKPHK